MLYCNTDIIKLYESTVLQLQKNMGCIGTNTKEKKKKKEAKWNGKCYTTEKELRNYFGWDY